MNSVFINRPFMTTILGVSLCVGAFAILLTGALTLQYIGVLMIGVFAG